MFEMFEKAFGKKEEKAEENLNLTLSLDIIELGSLIIIDSKP